MQLSQIVMFQLVMFLINKVAVLILDPNFLFRLTEIFEKNKFFNFLLSRPCPAHLFVGTRPSRNSNSTA